MSEQMSYTPEQASAKTGIKPENLRRAIRAGELRAKKHGRFLLITDKALRTWLDGLEDA